MKKKKIIVIAIALLIIVIVACICILSVLNKKSNNQEAKEVSTEKEEGILDEKVDIVDINSNSRPYAVVVNNTPVAVKVQEGLNKAYLVYEIPTEGNTSRLIALYKDIKEDLVIGTIRSARHNFIDYALESDAIFCCFGWSSYAKKDLESGSIDYLQGLYGGPFYRNNPENLASEHTAYTSISGLNKTVQEKGIRTTSNNSILLNYNVADVSVSGIEGAKVANTITIPYGEAPQITTFKYNNDTKMYTRYENNIACTDHNTKEEVTTKNIIIQKINYSMCDNNYYWNLDTIGTGEGYYITNGNAIEIVWKKDSRKNKTKYMYKTGTKIDGKDVGGQEISVSDGKTFIEVQTTNQKLIIE